MLLSTILPYKNLVLYLSLSLSLTLILTFLKLPIYFLHGLYTYIHPDSTNNSSQVKAAIRRPQSSSDSSLDNLRKRKNSKEKFEFDETKAQIFRLKLDENHLVTRIYFNGYRKSFGYFVIAMSCLMLSKLLTGDGDNGVFLNGNVVPIVLGLLGVCEVSLSVIRVSFEGSASRRSEKQLGVVVGVLGFLLGLLISFEVCPSLFGFEFGSVDGFWRFCVAVLMGCFTGFLFMPAVKNARSFWIGTDQLRWNLEIISCGWISRVLLYVNYLLMIFVSLLWINPLAKLLVNENIGDGKESVSRIGEADKLIGNVGMSRTEFEKIRIWCLFLSGTMHIMVLRPNLQMFLNEAVLSWYQRLHASKLPDLEFSRAKVFLHNHYLCLVVLQYFAAPALILLFLGLSQIDDNGNSFKNFQFLSSSLPSFGFAKEVALCMAWWVVFVWTTFASVTLVLYRRGILYVS